jgi:hypothetical protein
MAENLYFLPRKGTFDVAPIHAKLASMPDVFEDPLGTGTYLLRGIAKAVPNCRAARLANPSRFPYTCLVIVTPERVAVLQEYADRDGLRSARELVRWLVTQLDPEIQDERGADRTEIVRTQGVDGLYGPQLPPGLPDDYAEPAEPDDEDEDEG